MLICHFAALRLAVRGATRRVLKVNRKNALFAVYYVGTNGVISTRKVMAVAWKMTSAKEQGGVFTR